MLILYMYIGSDILQNIVVDGSILADPLFTKGSSVNFVQKISQPLHLYSYSWYSQISFGI